jgi:flavorubredoxin
MSLFGLDSSKPAPRLAPLEVAPDTFLVRALTASVGGTWTNLNSMVIRAAQPVIVDTGMITRRMEWFEDVFSLVPPHEVRWIFVTHNDSDHSGNLVEALERCPNAMVVTSHGESYRTNASFDIPLERMRMVDDGDDFHVGDRTLRALRPPVYDSPYTRGLFDPTTRVYYASDAFCAPNPEEPVDWVEDIPAARWEDEMARFHHVSLCPWISMVDRALFKAEVDKLAALDIGVLVGAHSPAIRGSSIPRAFEQMARLPSAAPPLFGLAGAAC